MRKPNLKSRLQICVLAILFQTTVYAQKQNYTKPVLTQIKKVEESLSGNIQIRGKKKWTIQERMRFYKVQGLSIAVVNNYKVEWAKGYGWADSAEQRHVTANTLFQTGSVSKSLNAVGVLKLAELKKIDLDKDINTYLTSWKFPYDSISKGYKITAKQLIGHTAGLSVWGFDGYTSKDTMPSMIQILDGKKPANSAAVRSIFQPGIKFQYSGGGSTISQLLIADVTGERYQDFMYNSILKPMGMANSFFGFADKENKQQLATAYSREGTEFPEKYFLHPEMAAAGLWSTPTSIAKFIIENQLSYKGKSNKVLSQETTRLMLQSSILTNNSILPTEAGLGVFIHEKDGNKYFLHKGGNTGFTCIYYGNFENGNGVIVMINSNNDKILEEVVNSVADVYDWKGLYNPTIKDVVNLKDSILESYIGDYDFAPNIVLSIKKEGNHLRAKATGHSMFEVFPESETKFFATNFKAEIEFLKNENGVIDKLKYSFNGDGAVKKKIFKAE